MTSAILDLDRATSLLGEKNVSAFLRLIRERESNQEDDAYTIINGGTHFTAPPWVHPYAGQSAPPGRAAGAFQYIPHTWQAVASALGFGDDFRPLHQDLGAVYLIAGRGALDDVIRGDVAASCIKCRPEWTSLPGAAEASSDWTIDKAIAIFKQWGGTLAGETTEEETPEAAPASPQGKPMGALALLQMFGPLITGMIPQVKNIVQPPPQSNAAKNIDLAQLLISTIVNAAGTAVPPTAPQQSADSQQLKQLAAAVSAMQADAELQKKVREAVVTEPKIMESLVVEIGGGIGVARDAGMEMQQAEKPFWYNPVVWVTVGMLPIVYMIVAQVLFTLAGPVLVSSGVADTPLVQAPWYAVIGFDSNTRTGLINLLTGYIVGGMCGIWFGTTVAQKRSAAQTTTEGTATTTTTTKT